MGKGIKKIASALAGLIAIVGINVGSVQAATPQLPSDKTPLVLEHGSVFHSPDGGTDSTRGVLSDHESHYSHSSHASHESHYSHYSGR
jgi:hypothetical protein